MASVNYGKKVCTCRNLLNEVTENVIIDIGAVREAERLIAAVALVLGLVPLRFRVPMRIQTPNSQLNAFFICMWVTFGFVTSALAFSSAVSL